MILQSSSFEDYVAPQRELLERIAEQGVRSRSLRISFVVVVLTRSIPLVWTSALCRCKVGPKETHRVCVGCPQLNRFAEEQSLKEIDDCSILEGGYKAS